MMPRILFWIVWALLILYAGTVAPRDNSATLPMISAMMSMNIGGINPLIIAVFNLMGVWPIIFACLLLFDREKKPAPAWPFIVGSFALGSFAILPYLGLRHAQPKFIGARTRLIRIIDSRITGVIILSITAAMMLWGLVNADWPGFCEIWASSMFINVMTVDFILLCLIFPFTLPDDISRRNWNCPGWLKVVFMLPMIGAALYLAIRPPAPEE